MKADNVKEFIEGFGSILDIMPADSSYQQIRIRKRPSEAENLSRDWRTVGSDLKKAMREVADEQEKQKSRKK